MKAKKQEIDKIEADWSNARKDVMRSKLASYAPEADLLAKEQSKNKLLSLCLENGRRLGFNAPVSSQNDVYKMYNKIQKLAEPDQLSIMRREIKFKKLLFSELPANYPLFKQYNITAKHMFQNLLALHAVDESNQESVSVEDIYDITESLTLPVKKQTKNLPVFKNQQLQILNGHHRKKSLSLLLMKMNGILVQFKPTYKSLMKFKFSF